MTNKRLVPHYTVSVFNGTDYHIRFTGRVPQTLECYFKEYIRKNLSWMIHSFMSSEEAQYRIRSCVDQELNRLVYCDYLKQDFCCFTEYDWLFLRE